MSVFKVLARASDCRRLEASVYVFDQPLRLDWENPSIKKSTTMAGRVEVRPDIFALLKGCGLPCLHAVSNACRLVRSTLAIKVNAGLEKSQPGLAAR